MFKNAPISYLLRRPDAQMMTCVITDFPDPHSEYFGQVYHSDYMYMCTLYKTVVMYLGRRQCRSFILLW